jgi:signal transduction histidine kinase
MKQTGKIQDLEKKLKTASGRDMLETLNELSAACLDESPQKALKYGLQALELTGAEVEPGARCDAMYNTANAYMNLSKYDLSLDSYEGSLELGEELGDKKRISNALFGIGRIYRRLGDYSKSLECHTKSLVIAEELNDKERLAVLYNNIGIVYLDMSNHEKALEHYLRSLRIMEEIEDKKGISTLLNNVGTIYEELKNYDKALDYHRRSLEMREEMEDKKGISASLNNIGVVYGRLNDFDKTIEYFSRSLKIKEVLGDKRGVALTSGNLGIAYSKKKQYEKALECHLEALKIREEIGDRGGIVTSLHNIGRFYLERKEYDEAVQYLEKGLKIGREIGDRGSIEQIYDIFAKLFSEKGDYKQALDYFQCYVEVKDEIFTEESSKKIAEMQIKYETEKKEKEAEIYRLKNVELAEALEKLKDAQQQLILKEKMATLGNLVAGIAHEINNPVGAMKGAADVSHRCVSKIVGLVANSKTVEELQTNSKYQAMIKMLDDNAELAATACDRIIRVISSLTKFARLEEEDYQQVDIHEGIESTLELIRNEMSGSVTIEKEYADVPEISCYPRQLNQVFMILMMNAIEAIGKKGTITIRTFAEEDQVRITLSDTGRGIPPERLENIFDLAFSTKDSRIGISSSLPTVFNIIQKHEGNIEVKSEPGKGTEFTITLPIGERLT